MIFVLHPYPGSSSFVCRVQKEVAFAQAINSYCIPHQRRKFVKMSEKTEAGADPKATDVSTIEDVLGKGDNAAVAVAEEHSMTVKDAILNNKRVVCWCVFFAFSAIGW
jgi:hypothetical protein